MVALAVLVLPCAFALAQPDAPVHVKFTAFAGCGDRAGFLAALRERLPRLHVTDAEGPARTVVVRIERRGGGIAGHLTFRETDGSESERAVAGSSCGEVLDGLALVTAVAIDPTALGAPQTDAAAATAPDAGTPPVAAVTPSATVTAASPAVDAGAPDAGAPAEAPPPAASSAVPPRSERRWSAGIGADATLVAGISPDVLVAVPVFLEGAHKLGGRFAAGVALRFVRTGGASQGAAGGADFTWTAGALDLCPLLWSPPHFGVGACVRAQAGVLDAVGLGVTPSRSASRPWLDVGGAVHLRWFLLGTVFLELTGALDVPLVRDRFFLEPDVTLFRAPPVGGSGGVGVGADIW